MTRFAQPVPPPRPDATPTLVGWKADAEKERRRGRELAADVQAPGKFPRPPRRPW